MNEYILIGIAFGIIILIAIYDAYTVLWGLTHKKVYNVTWHWLNALLRTIVVAGIVTKSFSIITKDNVWHYIFMTSGIMLIQWMPFDCIINWVRFRKLFYDAKEETGSVAITDILDGWKYYGAQVLCVVLGVLILIFL